MPEKRRIQEPPVRIKRASRTTAERIADATGLNYIQVIEQAVEAAGQHFDHHGGRLILPLRFHETFFVYQVTAPQALPLQPKRIRAVVITDAEGLVLNIDPAFTEMCGYTLEELRGRKPGELLQGKATEQEIVEQFREALREQVPFECTITNYHKNGSTYRVHIKCDPVFDAKGQLVQFRAVETLVSGPTILLEPPDEPKSGREEGRNRKKKPRPA